MPSTENAPQADFQAMQIVDTYKDFKPTLKSKISRDKAESRGSARNDDVPQTALIAINHTRQVYAGGSADIDETISKAGGHYCHAKASGRDAAMPQALLRGA
jgi:hypothetical protein